MTRHSAAVPLDRELFRGGRGLGKLSTNPHAYYTHVAGDTKDTASPV